MDTVASTRSRARRAVAAVAAVAALTGTVLVGGQAGASTPAASSKAKANIAKVSDGTLAWGVSKYVLGANPAVMSLAETQKAEPPATVVVGTGWKFTDGTGTYDTKTGATLVSFPGALEFGNTSFGNYGFKFAEPTVALDAAGNGTLSADVSVRPAGAAAFGAAAETVIANITGATPTKTKKNVTVTLTPTAFADPLLAAAGDLSPFFKPTGSSNDGNKPPEPITLSFAYKAKAKKS